jgi:hypothetical protein
MRESRTYGFVRGAHSDMRPYRDPCYVLRRAAGQLNRSRMQDNQILISAYDEILKRGVLSQLLNDW